MTKAVSRPICNDFMSNYKIFVVEPDQVTIEGEIIEPDPHVIVFDPDDKKLAVYIEGPHTA